MTRPSIGARFLLRLRHLLYAHKGQEESPDCRFWAANIQPRPEAYIWIRKLFDSLRYAYCPSARVFSYESLHNFVLMYPPTIPAPYPGAIDFGRFMIMTDNRHYADLLRSKLKNGTQARYHYVHIIQTGQFACLEDYLDFLELLVFFEHDACFGETVLFETMGALNGLRASLQESRLAENTPSQTELPEDRLAIDFDHLDRTTRQKDTWI